MAPTFLGAAFDIYAKSIYGFHFQSPHSFAGVIVVCLALPSL